LKKSLLFVLSLLFITNASSQTRPNIKTLVDALGRNARVYFLSANRPSYGVSAFTVGKDNIELYTGVSFGDGFAEVPVQISYGITKNIELFGTITPFLQTYDFEGNQISGFGDAGIGAKFKIHESEHFSHAIETVVKIPTASSTKELGTGRVDFHFGLGHAYSADVWGYDAGIELNLLHRRDLPGIGPDVPLVLRNAIDSIKKVYDYKYEPEIGFSLGPVVYPSARIYIYSGFAFSRNTKLDYSSSSIFAGTGYLMSNVFSLSAGASYGLSEGGSWMGSVGLTFFIQRKTY
jgi:hypothetical protein